MDKEIVNYHLVQNAAGTNFHDAICKESKKVKAKGILKDLNGKAGVYRLSDKTAEREII
ncbi:MAG: hypothetical protein ABI651_14480 [Verrucomicrobiota bacterium]